jgi:hypothetical protein
VSAGSLLLLGDTFALFGMHAESQLEVAENKGGEEGLKAM